MNPITRPLQPHADYVCRRVIDALLREDVRQCISRGRIYRPGEDAPAAGLPAHLLRGTWLAIDHLGAGRLWIPVIRAHFLQAWRIGELPIWREESGAFSELRNPAKVLSHFAAGLDNDEHQRFMAFAEECRVAIAHREACESARRAFFSAHAGTDWTHLDGMSWTGRLAHFERLGAFLDHPLYPTARAKLGFALADLAAYGPEFGAPFTLRWLAVPQARYHGQGEVPETIWPGFRDVGLDPGLGASHRLVPVHPFVWEHHLAGYLRDHRLDGSSVLAPRGFLQVLPTLSVRTVIPATAPDIHLKLPLTIRTLGASNVRTIKPSTIADGHTVQQILGHIENDDPALRGRVLLTDESTGAHVSGHALLGFIARRYPSRQLRGCTAVPVAALLATTPSGSSVFASLAERFYGGDLTALFDAYVETTFRIHLALWLRYGIALESNQQNSVMVLSEAEPRVRMLLKDNDAPRILSRRLRQRRPDLEPLIAALRDERILVDGETPLAQMFTTITLQLNIGALVEGLAEHGGAQRARLYARVRDALIGILGELEQAGEDTAPAAEALLRDEHLYIKRLLTAASLRSKAETGARDVNKYYGKTAANFLLVT